MSGHFDALFTVETICLVLFNDVHLHLIFYPITLKVDPFHKSSFSLYYLTLLYDGDQLQ